MVAIDRMRASFGAASMPLKLIWINAAIFVVLRLAVVVGLLFGARDPLHAVLGAVELPSRLDMLAHAPWTLATYMFAQYDVLHILFNMLWLYWFGTMMLYRCTPAQMLVLYVYGGIGGAALFLAAYNLLPLFDGSTGMLIGSSASVMAIVTATAILMPDFGMRLLFIGVVKLKWIALATVALVLLGVSGANAGGEIAHVGGILTGVAFALCLRQGRDITRPVRNLFSHTGRRKSSPAPAPTIGDDDRRDLDAILDKIKRSGYSALTPAERRRLFEVSRNIK